MYDVLKDEIKKINWKSVSEEDFYELRRKKIRPILVYRDIDNNMYYFFDKKRLLM